MKIQENYVIDNTIKAISSRLNYMAKDRNSSRYYVDTKIKLENLKYNYSHLLSQIILKLDFIVRGREEFLEIINDYNTTNGTNLTIADFESINWIYEACNEIRIPELIRHYIWKIEYELSKENEIAIPLEYLDLIKCIQLFYDRYYKKAQLVIYEKDLKKILKEQNSREITIEILLEKAILNKTETKSVLAWSYGSEYVRHLSDEITATLWQEVGGENAEFKDFKLFYKLIRGAKVWPNNLIKFLPHKSRIKLAELALSYLKSEQDLKRSKEEFNKIWLNAKDNNNHGIARKIPEIQFNYEDQYQFIESINEVKWIYRQLFDFQHSRRYMFLLIRLIIEAEADNGKPFQTLLKLLDNMDMPIVILSAYSVIPSQYPEVIPLLLTNTNIIPLAFKLIDKIEINTNFVTEQSDRDKIYTLTRQEINVFWNEMFSVTLNIIELNSFETKTVATMLARIFADLAEKVFNSSGTNSNTIAEHNIYKKRYEEALIILAAKRFSNNRMQTEDINPRVIFFYLPEISNYICAHLGNQKSDQYPFLRLNSGLFDLGIEVLRLLTKRTSESEISKNLISDLKASSTALAGKLKSVLDNFYSIDEIEVPTYDERKTELRKASRRGEEFGFEIVDWAFLFLYFEQLNLLNDLDRTVIGSLAFNTSSDKYDDQNREQGIKLKLYIKSLLLAFHGIKTKKAQYDLEALPTSTTLKKLEEWIQRYAIAYSTNDIANQKIDVFNDMYHTFGYNIYHQQLADLLFSCIHYFQQEMQESFVRDYFSGNDDVSRMLTAINIIDNKNLQDIISERIQEVGLQSYIDGRFMITDLEYALLEAVNSDQHWELAETLLNNVQQHFERVSMNDDAKKDFLFEVNLLLAFKKKNLEILDSLEIPQRPYRVSGENVRGKQLKRYFRALFKIYNEHEYDEAIITLKTLQAEDPKNIRYNFQLFKAQTLKAIRS